MADKACVCVTMRFVSSSGETSDLFDFIFTLQGVCRYYISRKRVRFTETVRILMYDTL